MKADHPPGVAKFICNGAPGILGIVVAPGIAIQVDGSNQLGVTGCAWAAAVPVGNVKYKEVIGGAAHSALINARGANIFLIMGTSSKTSTDAILFDNVTIDSFLL
ncbi:MAG: hypothetical protein OEV07_03885 [Gammaproteobacteria bacterium]|nr:hypothetical protein [Gammaproteobacteria bacterium]